jgi:hypothetical protein
MSTLNWDGYSIQEMVVIGSILVVSLVALLIFLFGRDITFVKSPKQKQTFKKYIKE